MKEPEEAKTKILLVFIREEHNMSSLSTILWASCFFYLAGALAKNSSVIDVRQKAALTCKRHSYGLTLFAIKSYVPARTLVEWNERNEETDDAALRFLCAAN